jgi:hypothetical protein
MLSEPLLTGTKRRDDRVLADGAVICRRGANRQPTQLADLSRSGVRLKTTVKLHVDERVWLKLPMLEPLEARVIWVKGFEAGCQFLVPLHPAVFQAISRSV